MKRIINKWISFGIWFVLVLLVTGITFAAYNQLSDVSDTDILTSTIWNQMIDNQDDSNLRLSNLESKSTYGWVFSVSPSTSVSTSDINTRKIIPFNTKKIDTNNFFNTSLNRFQPTIAWYYRINLNLNISMTWLGAFTLYWSIFKNGITYRTSYELIDYSASFIQSINVSDIIYFNGTTDYIDWRFQTNIGTASSSTSTFMSGEFIRP